MRSVHICLLGTLQLHVHDKSVPITSPIIRSVLAYLALYAHDSNLAQRNVVSGVLWPNLPEARARRTLNEAIYRLRILIGDAAPWLQVKQRTLGLRDVSTDVDAFRLAAQSVELGQTCRAIDLYQGDLLEHSDAEWLIEPRLWLRDLFLSALARACRELARSNCYADAVAYAHRWARADPYNEDAHRAVMRLEARLGRHVAALKQYDALVALLEDDLQTCPLPETRALASAIRAEYDQTDAIPEPRPLIGRSHERARLLQLIEQAQSGRGGCLVLLDGEPGIGKTYLLDAIVQSAAWRGATVARAHAAIDDIGWCAPLVAALQTAISGEQIATLWAQLPEAERTRLAAFAVQLDAAHAATAPPDDLERAGALATALGMVSNSSPLVILLDNLEHAGASFWQFLLLYAPLLVNQRVCCVLSYRDYEIRANSIAWRVLCELDRNLNPPQLHLRRFSAAQCSKFALALDVALSAEAADVLHRNTAGNPQLVHELLAAPPGELPNITLQRLIEQRLVSLSEAARDVLYIAAVIGPTVEYDLLCAVFEGGLGETLAHLRSNRCLEACHAGYKFPHDLLREYVYDQLAPEQRRNLHCRVAHAMLKHHGDQATAAQHWSRGENWRQAAQCFQSAGDQALAHGDHGAACDLYACGMEALGHMPADDPAHAALYSALVQHNSAEAAPVAASAIWFLARDDAPIGRSLNDAERVAVRWTIDGGATDRMLLAQQGKVSLRRHRIVRLLEQATQQGATPTAAEIAGALGVTERTIIADMATLRQNGQMPLTRRYRHGSAH